MSDYVLQTCDLTKRYGHQLAVNHVDMNLRKGEIYGLIGKNGAGKTTIMKMICGLISVSQGEMRLFDSDDLNRARKRIGCVIEQPALYPDMTARENLCYYSRLIGAVDDGHINTLLGQVGLSDTGRKKARHFSLGMKQRLSIAIALLGHPDFLVLDEPINGLDPSGIREVRELLLQLNREKHITMLISSHILGELGRIATCYGIIRQGEMVEELRVSELRERFQRCLTLQVDDAKKAVYILREKFKLQHFKVLDGGKLQIFDDTEHPALLNRALVINGIEVSEMAYEGDDMENYFLKRMGGDA